MKSKRLFLSLILVSVFVLSCSKTDGIDYLFNSEVQNEDQLIDDSIVQQNNIIGGDVLFFLPGNLDLFNFETVEENNDYIFTRANNVRKVIVEDLNNNVLIINGDIDYIVVKQTKINGEITGAVLMEIRGTYDIVEPDAQSIMNKMAAPLGESGCSTDKDCLSQLIERPGFERVCIDGECGYQ